MKNSSFQPIICSLFWHTNQQHNCNNTTTTTTTTEYKVLNNWFREMLSAAATDWNQFKCLLRFPPSFLWSLFSVQWKSISFNLAPDSGQRSSGAINKTEKLFLISSSGEVCWSGVQILFSVVARSSAVDVFILILVIHCWGWLCSTAGLIQHYPRCPSLVKQISSGKTLIQCFDFFCLKNWEYM